MSARVFVAGATGAVGKPLVSLLTAQGYEVWGTARFPDKARTIEDAGASAIVVDVFDAAALGRAVMSVRPGTIVHQLTDLPAGLDPARMAEAVPRNARIRREGTKNLVAAALAAGTRKLISQSIAWRAQGITAEGVGTGRVAGGEEMPLHVDAAASAALLALEKGRAGTIYDIVESDAGVAIDAARRELGWDPRFRLH
ncbi:MAG TPA: NAD-dependent epimerase/dehydratase family protein [Burkholderiales bacterium]